MSNQAGKGDDPRPVDKKKYNENFDEINWVKKKKDVPKKKVKNKIRYSY